MWALSRTLEEVCADLVLNSIQAAFTRKAFLLSLSSGRLYFYPLTDGIHKKIINMNLSLHHGSIVNSQNPDQNVDHISF